MPMNRRRFLAFAAAGTASGLAGLGQPGFAAQATVWEGVALGARARITIDHDPHEARQLIAAMTGEIARLEGLFSLYRADSAISRLNRDGRLDHPVPDFLSLLSVCDRINTASGGAFDPTIQSAWAALAERYKGGNDAAARAAINVGWKDISFAPREIAFARPDMAITLNGIAQGYITDRIAALMRDAGLNHILVDMGEMRSVGPRKDGSAWPIGIGAVRDEAKQMRLILKADRALAVSHSRGTVFDPEGRMGHILDPTRGRPVPQNRHVAVEASSAVLADGISTALCVTGEEGTGRLADAFPGADIETHFITG